MIETADQRPENQKQNMKTEVIRSPALAKPEHIQEAVSQAKEMLARASVVNAAQYAHGINSTSASIEWYLRQVEQGRAGDYDGLNMLRAKVMQLGGYLYSLKENI